VWAHHMMRTMWGGLAPRGRLSSAFRRRSLAPKRFFNGAAVLTVRFAQAR